jgi:hypothetical protein
MLTGKKSYTFRCNHSDPKLFSHSNIPNRVEMQRLADFSVFFGVNKANRITANQLTNQNEE